MARPVVAILLGAAVVAAAAPTFGQADPAAATDVAPLVVTGRRAPPVEMLPPFDACFQSANDPYMAALIAAGGLPSFYVRTRPPRNPDYSAPPRTPPGSPLPEVLSLRDYRTQANQLRLANDVARGDLSGADAARMAAIARCLDGAQDDFDSYFPNPLSEDLSFSGPSGRGSNGRMEILFRDKTLPLAFALFEDGRYEEALVQFKAHDRKIYSTEAMLTIGKIYLYALRDKTDPVEGVAWLKKAAGSAFNSWTATPRFDPREPNRNTAMGEASMILADLYATGRGPIPKDAAQSRKFLERAYYVGHIPAATRLGDIYYNGVDTPRDLKKAFRHYRDAAKFAHVPAMNALARMYAAGEVEAGPDPVKALTWRNEAAKFDDPAALYSLAVAYDRGEGVDKDADRALSLYKLAAMNGHAGAQGVLGSYFYRGEGELKRDHVIARQWFEQAAIGGDADGLFKLADMLARGEGGGVDRVKAWGWLKIAERQGNEKAAPAIRALEAQFTAADRAGVADLAAKRAAP